MNKPYVVVMAPIASRSGYGDHSRDLLRALVAVNKYEINVLNINWGGCPNTALDEKNDADLLKLFVFGKQLPKQPDVFIQITVPNEFKPIGKYNIGITAGIETNKCAPQWLEGCNRMDEIIVPSNFSKHVLETTEWQTMHPQTKQPAGKLTLTKPISVLFEGVDTDVYYKTDELSEPFTSDLSDIPEDWCYLFVGHWLQGHLGHDRKDISTLIRVFLSAFKDTDNPPALILKTSGAGFSVMDREDVLKKISTIRATVKGDKLPNIYLIHGDLETNEINSLYNNPKVKAMVSFTKGEGYGRPLAEFATVGKPMIVSNCSGHLDFMKSQYVELLPGNFQNVHPSAAAKDMILEESKWFYVNPDTALSRMKDVYSNYSKYAKRASGLPKYIENNFTLEKMSEMFVEKVDSVLEGVPKQAELKLPKLTKPGNVSKLPKLERVK